MESIGDSSSGCLIDIQIDESLSRETLMSIDSANQKEDCGIFTFFSALLVLCFFSYLFLPNLTTTLKYNYMLHDRPIEYTSTNHQSSIDAKQNIKQKYATFSIESLSSTNQFLLLSVSFIKKSQTNLQKSIISNISNFFSEKDFLMSCVDIAIQTDLSNQIHVTDFSSHSIPNSILFFPQDQNASQKVPLLKYQLTKYTTFSSTVSISNNNYDLNGKLIKENSDLFNSIVGCRVYWTFGNNYIPFYQSFIKLTFFIVNFISMVSFLYRTKCNASILHLEQILSILLLFFTFLIDNPFHYLLIAKFPKISLIYDEISKTIFNVYLRFFIFVLFDSLRFKNRRIGRCFFLPKILFFFFFLFSELLSSLVQAKKAVDFKWPNPLLQGVKLSDVKNMNKIFRNELKIDKQLNLFSADRLLHTNLYFGLINNDFFTEKTEKNFYGKAVFFFSKIFEISFAICLILVVTRSFKEIDATERYKFFMYFSVSAIMFLLIGITDCFLSQMKKFGNTLTPFIVKLSIYNFFALLMIFFHWPYELITDQQYLDPDEVENDVADFYNESDKSNDSF